MVELQDILTYFANPVTRSILKASVRRKVDFEWIVKEVGEPQKGIGAWLLEMRRKGVLDWADATPGSNTPAKVSMAPEAKQLLKEFCGSFVDD